MPKTLYVSDLDGTLLRSDKTLSSYTVKAVNAFIAGGGLFTFASARSPLSALELVAPLALALPASVFNGTFLIDPRDGSRLQACTLAPDCARRILEALAAQKMYPLVYAFIEGEERVSWLSGAETEGIARYVAEKAGHRRLRPVRDAAQLLEGGIFYLTLIDTRERVMRAEDVAAGQGARLHTLRDTYHPQDFWLEISPMDAGKDRAIARLRERTGAERVVCFGDNLNDIPMFEQADEAYAVAGAMDALVDMATGVIASNDEDGVARFLAGL